MCKKYVPDRGDIMSILERDVNISDGASFFQRVVREPNHVSTVIRKAETPLRALDSLEASLVVLHRLLIQENEGISDEKTQILAELWTFLGRNKNKIKTLDRNLYLLQNVDQYRKQAAAHVVSACNTLIEMRGELENMRTKVSIEPVEGDLISVEVQIRSIEAGTERLRDLRQQPPVFRRVTKTKTLGLETEQKEGILYA